MLRALSSALLATLLTAGATADYRLVPDGPIATDRPGNGNAATSVTRGHLNLEWGPLYAHPGGAHVHQLSFPLLLRFGLLERLELRAGSGLVGIEPGGSSRGASASATDTSAGLKVAALHGDGPRPDLAFSADVFLPTGAGAFTAGVAVPELRALAAWALPEGFGLLLNLGGDVPESGSGGRYLRFVHVVNLSYAPAGLDGRVSLFVETFGRQATGHGSEQIVQLDWGVSGLLSDDLQLDLFLQHGLTDDAPQLQLSVGCSLRL